MLVPYSAIVELLATFEPRAVSEKNTDTAYRWVELFSPELGFESRDTIYVAPLSAMRDIPLPEGFLCICPNDLNDKGHVEYYQPGMLVLDQEDIKLGILVRMIKNYIMKLQDWEKTIIRCVMEKDLQELLLATGEIIGNTFLLYNDSFRLLAYYVTDSNDDKYYGDLIKANVSRIDWGNDFPDQELSPPLLQVIPGGGGGRLAGKFIARTITVQDYPRGQIYMFCEPDTATPGRIALFEIVQDWLRLFFEREAPIVENSKNIEAFLIDLIENRSTDSQSVSNRADYCGIQVDRFYCLFAVRFKGTYRDIEATRLLKALARALPNARLLPYFDSILIINYYKMVVNRSENEGWLEAIRDILKGADAEVGISTPEESLRNLRVSYRRAVLAIEYGKRVRRMQPFDIGNNTDTNRYTGYDIYAYEIYYIYHIIDTIHTENRMILESSVSIRALAKLYAFDRENKTDNIKLLYCYLINERSASKTASVMHMHRNNVIYRINRIEQIVSINLDESQFRFKLLFSYRVIDYYGVDYLKDIDYSTIGTDLSKKQKSEYAI